MQFSSSFLQNFPSIIESFAVGKRFNDGREILHSSFVVVPSNGSMVTFTDGSPSYTSYLTGSYCTWLITPQSPSSSFLTISIAASFWTYPATNVAVYDGFNTSAPLLGTVSEFSSATFASSQHEALFVLFVSVDDIGTGKTMQ